jgi:hypothetical protein
MRIRIRTIKMNKNIYVTYRYTTPLISSPDLRELREQIPYRKVKLLLIITRRRSHLTTFDVFFFHNHRSDFLYFIREGFLHEGTVYYMSTGIPLRYGSEVFELYR